MRYKIIGLFRLIGVNIIIVSIFLVLIEVALRISFRPEEVYGSYWRKGAFAFDPEIGFMHSPGFQGQSYRKGDFDVEVNINEFGFRQSNIDKQLRFKNRLLVLGDSFGFGLGVKEEESFCSILANELNKQQIGLINSSQVGQSVTQEVILGKRLIEKFDPELILICPYLQNDVLSDLNPTYMNYDWAFGQSLDKNRRFKFVILDYIRANSWLWQFFYHRVYSRVMPNIGKFFSQAKISKEKTDPRKMLQPTLEALKELMKVCQENNIKLFVLVCAPPSGSTEFDPYFIEFLNNNEIRHIDLNGQMELSDYFKTDGHWNAKGHNKVAEKLVEYIVP